MPDLPLVEELPASLSAVDAYYRLAHLRHCVFLDSALMHPELGRYSFVAAEPFSFVTTRTPSATILDEVSEQLVLFSSPAVAGLPPFQGGAVALLSYEFGRSFERLSSPRFDEFELPFAAIGLYDVVLAFDHQEQRGWLVSHGWPETNEGLRHGRAQRRRQEFLDYLANPSPGGDPHASKNPIAAQQLAPQFAMQGPMGLTSNFNRDQYLTAVRRAIDYIYAGDIFQVNLAQRLLYPAASDSVDLYLRLRARNPATFASYFNIGDFRIISASPERFVSVRDRLVEAQPIKGTRSRTARPEADLFAADDLQQSEKDRAENVMIVDLMRNDLAKVCESDSVRVTQLCGLELYQFVQHLVSVVQGKLRPDCTPVDVLRATFPGGSITGAPKVRAMEIIAELEPTARGAYCGSLGYIGFDGTMDFNILIRTITAGRGWWQLPVGGGIVAQSDPEHEYEETWQKALGMIKALT